MQRYMTIGEALVCERERHSVENHYIVALHLSIIEEQKHTDIKL